jgi:hypothetical protein
LKSDELRMAAYQIRCLDEGIPLSNIHNVRVWRALEMLLRALSPYGVRFEGSNDRNSSAVALSPFDWKDVQMRASARQAYAWRNVIEDVKNSDLGSKLGEGRMSHHPRGRTQRSRGAEKKDMGEDEEIALASDKPTMLKLAGEVTNALLHSYTRAHVIRFETTTSG